MDQLEEMTWVIGEATGCGLLAASAFAEAILAVIPAKDHVSFVSKLKLEMGLV